MIRRRFLPLSGVKNLIHIIMTPTPKTWEQQKSALKVKFPALLPEDLNFIEEKKAEMLAALVIKLKVTNEQLLVVMQEA